MSRSQLGATEKSWGCPWLVSPGIQVVTEKSHLDGPDAAPGARRRDCNTTLPPSRLAAGEILRIFLPAAINRSIPSADRRR